MRHLTVDVCSTAWGLLPLCYSDYSRSNRWKLRKRPKWWCIIVFPAYSDARFDVHGQPAYLWVDFVQETRVKIPFKLWLGWVKLHVYLCHYPDFQSHLRFWEYSKLWHILVILVFNHSEVKGRWVKVVWGEQEFLQWLQFDENLTVTFHRTVTLSKKAIIMETFSQQFSRCITVYCF